MDSLNNEKPLLLTYQPREGNLSGEKNNTKKGIDNVLMGLNRFGFLNLSLEERIEKLKNTSFDDFMKFIIYLRKSYGIEVEDKKEGFKTKKDKLENNRGSISFFWVVDYIGPDNPYEQIRKIYEEIQRNINMENYKEKISILYFAIIVSQMFQDGNGRTALGIYDYYTQEEVKFESFKEHENKTSWNLGLSGHKKLIYEIVLKGIGQIYKDFLGIETIPSFLNGKEIKEGEFGVKIIENGKTLIGNDSFLRYFAAAFILSKSRGTKIDIGNTVNLDEFSKSERTQYEELYNKIRNMIFGIYMEEVKKNIGHYSNGIDLIKNGDI